MDSNQLEQIIENGRTFFSSVKEDNHRYLSWEHCHKEFIKHRGTIDATTIDTLALHLGFYLASWGMYRGSSFLLQKDYRIHIPIVEIIMHADWEDLWGINAEKFAEEKTAKCIVDLSNAIKNAYIDNAKHEPTPTLITKILLGTIGCAPAYDRYFKAGLKRADITQTFGFRSLNQVGKLYYAHKVEFDELRIKFSESSGVPYTPAKVLDMCFFESGMEGE